MMMYADPGSGVLIWQILLALFFGATFSFSKLKGWVLSRYRPAQKLTTAEAAGVTNPRAEGE